MAHIEMSPVKRERLKKEAQLRQKKKMRSDLPVLTKEQVRRCRMPLHEALFIELADQKMPSSAAFLKQLINFQEWLRVTHGPDSRIWSKPRLVERPEILDQLCDSLKAAEMSHYAGDYATECDKFLELGAKYALGTNDWWWLGEQIMVQCVQLCARYHGDGSRREATSRYVFGKFLLENVKDREHALTQLKLARELAAGHSWTATSLLHCLQKAIFVEVCILLYRALLWEAKDIMVYDPKAAIKLCIEARRRAYDACDHLGEAMALMLQGNGESLADDVRAAAQSFYKALVISIKAKRLEETCEARIALLLAYLKLGQWSESYAHLQILLDFAQSNNLPYYIGQSYRYMGEYYLNHGNPNLATPLLIKALNTFHEIGDVDNREQTKNFAAVSAGQELMPKYVDFLLKCGIGGRKGYYYTERLVKWKDIRDIGWSEYRSASSISFEDALQITGESGCELSIVLEEHSGSDLHEGMEGSLAGDAEEAVKEHPRADTESVQMSIT